MKFITKLFLPAIFILFLNFPLFSQETKSVYYIQSDTGISFRRFGEHIYSYSDSHRVSYLEYNAILSQTNIQFGYTFNNLEISAGLGAVLPLKCGSFYDYDYMENGTCKNLCFFDNYATGNIAGHIAFIFPSLSVKRLSFRPLFKIQYNYDSFIGKQGWGYFGTKEYSKNGEDVAWNSEYARKAKKVSSISLDTHNFFVFAGLFLGIELTPKIKLALNSYITPFTYAYSLDYHYDDTGGGQDYQLIEIQTAFFKNFKESLQLEFNLTNKFSLVVSCDWLFRPVIEGTIEDSYQPSGSDISLVYLGAGIKTFF